MPFTISHAVAVLPISKYFAKYTAFSALIIGSMTPDFAYLTPFLVDQRVDSHSLLGIYLFCIPMGLTVYFIYHFFMAPVIVSILPKKLQQHLNKDLFIGKIPDIPSFTLISSLVIGSFTHIFWDFFTHQSGIPQYINWMDAPLSTVDGFDIMPYRLLQHFSSVFGLSLLIFLIWEWYKRKELSNHSSIPNSESSHWKASKTLKIITRFTLLIIPISIGIISGLINLPKSDVLYGIYGAQVFVRNAIVGSAGGLILACIILGIFYQINIYRTTKRRLV